MTTQQSIERVTMMADADQTKWDLSENDQLALRDVLRIAVALREVYAATLPAGTVRASEIERICAHNGVASLLVSSEGGSKP